MARLFKIFNFQDAVQEIREQVSSKGGLEPCFKLLQAITDDMQIEDMPFYNQYLSKFDLEQSFSSYKLLLDDDIDASPEDINLLQRFIFGSFSCKYEITFNDKDKTYAIKIIASYENVTDSKLLHDFSYLRIKNLMTIILKEQLNLEGFRDEDEVSTELIDEQREEKLIEFKDHINRQKSSK